MTFATFVLSTGRCGTQWLAEQLPRSYGDRFRVEHEPLHNFYAPRQNLSVRTLADLSAEAAEAILPHVEEIETCLAQRSYLECGHPCWSALPALADRFRGRVRIIHLVRHPVPTAFSWLTHRAYEPPLLPFLPTKTLLSPFDPGILLPEYQERWEGLTAFEKCLYYWSEVNLFGLAQEQALGVPWLRLTYEDLFFADGLERLLEFLELPPTETLTTARAESIDRFRSLTPQRPDLNMLARHPRIIEAARTLGYEAQEIDVVALQRRYQGYAG
jgi:hypothetical protein